MNTSISNNWTRRSEDRRVHPPALGVSRVINLIFYFFRYSQSVKYAKYEEEMDMMVIYYFYFSNYVPVTPPNIVFVNE